MLQDYFRKTTVPVDWNDPQQFPAFFKIAATRLLNQNKKMCTNKPSTKELRVTNVTNL